MSKSRYFYAVAITLLLSCRVSGDIFLPTGLEVGDEYRIVFVTNGTVQATNDDLEFYDQFVTAQASAGIQTSALISATWQIIGSSADDNANNHTDTLPPLGGVPIYLADGHTRIADDYGDLWDLEIDAPINRDQNGNTLVADVFSGTSGTGARRSQRYLGSGGLITIGNSGLSSAGWITTGDRTDTLPTHVYGISSILVAVPEPSPLLIFAMALLYWAIHRHRCGYSSRALEPV